MKDKSRMAFVVNVTQKDGEKVRTPWSGTGKQSKEFFAPRDESDYLREALGGVPYATYTTDTPDDMQFILENGYEYVADHSQWRVFFSFWKGRTAHAFLVPDKSPVTGLEFAGVITLIRELGYVTRTAKGINRLFSPLPAGIEATWGDEVYHNAEFRYSIIKLDILGADLTEEDKHLTVKYVPFDGMTDEQKALCDGAILVSEKAVRRLKLNHNRKTGEVYDVSLGMAWRVTVSTPQAFGKGHALYVPDLEVDIVIFGPKPYLRTERFYFGNMDALHVGNTYTDRQAFVNFDFHRKGLAYASALVFMKTVYDAFYDEMKMKRLFNRHSKMSDDFVANEDHWILEDALRYGISYLRFPGLAKRVVNYLAGYGSQVFQCDMNARIPTDGAEMYGYVLPDPMVFDKATGLPHPERSLIPDGCLVFPDINAGTPVIVYRQPSEHASAFYALTITYDPYYKGFAGRGVCLLGRGADKVLKTLGGGDLDDQLKIVYGKAWVASFKTLKPYPVTEKVSDEIPAELLYTETEEPSLGDGSINHTQRIAREIELSGGYVPYNEGHVLWQLQVAKDTKVNLGTAVNVGMLDMILSHEGHKANMLADLERRGLMANYKWLEKYVPFQFALLMTNLERVIDGTVKDPTLLRPLFRELAKIRPWHEACMVYPTCMYDKVPKYKLDKKDFVFANSLMCDTLDSIRVLRERLLKEFKLVQWKMVGSADLSLQGAYPSGKFTKLVRGNWRMINQVWTNLNPGFVDLTHLWKDEWSKTNYQKPDPDGVRAQRAKNFIRICDLVAKRMRGATDPEMRAVAAELYYDTYKGAIPPRTGPNGEIQDYPDGLLWSPVFAKHFIDALRVAKLTGYYVSLEVLPEFRAKLLNRDGMVQVKNHLVYVRDKQGAYTVLVGAVYEGSKDGVFPMYHGLIEFEKPQPICLPLPSITNRKK